MCYDRFVEMAGPGTNFTWVLSESAAQAITFRNSDGTINQTIYNAMQGSIGTSPQARNILSFRCCLFF
jgi:hypothetical protein